MIAVVVLMVAGLLKWPWWSPLVTIVIVVASVYFGPFQSWVDLFGGERALVRFTDIAANTLVAHYGVYSIMRVCRYLWDRWRPARKSA